MSKSTPTPPLDREAKRRLAVIRHVEEVSGNVAMSCRYFGISRQAYYTWYRRYQAEGVEGLRARVQGAEDLPERDPCRGSREDHLSPAKRPLGAEKVAMYLKRYHDVPISKSGVWRILNRLDMGRLPGLAALQEARPQMEAVREAAARPPRPDRGEVHRTARLDAPGAPRRPQQSLQFTAIDDCTRLRVLRIYPTLDQAAAIQFLDYVIQRLPFQVEVLQTDNGAEFQSAFHWHVLDKGIAHTYIKPRTPRLNGKVERSHRIDAEEFYRLLDGVIIDDAEVFNDKLREWEDYYNYHRPHGGLGGQTPYERLKQKTATQA